MKIIMLRFGAGNTRAPTLRTTRARSGKQPEAGQGQGPLPADPLLLREADGCKRDGHLLR